MGLLSTIGAASGRAFGLTRVGAAIRDAYFNLTTLLLPGNGTNGAQNNTFLDSSSNNFTITRNGNTTQGTFSPFSQTGWSNYLNGSTDYFRVSDNAAFDFGTGAFCIEMWFMLTADAAQNGETNREATLLAAFPDSGTLSSTYAIGIGGNSTTTGTAIAFSIRLSDTTAVNKIYTATITKNVWHHIAVCRSGNDFAMFYDGSRVVSDASYTYTVDTNHSVKIGALIYPTYNHYFPGYISNLRMVKGASVYTPTNSSITVPTAALTAITNTSLLTCQSNRFVDNSSNAFAITVNGTPFVQAFSPFAPTAAYSAATVGGSGYFDGNGDYLVGNGQLSTSTSMSTFTVEGWLYPTSLANNYWIIGDMDAVGATNVLSVRTGQLGDLVLYWYDGAAKECFSPNGSIRANQWNWFAIVVNNNAISMYVNSTTAASLTGTTTLTNRTQTNNFALGQQNNSVTFLGYMGNLRWSSGIARTISSIPTAPYTSDANTRLLVNFTNAGITDATAKNVLETVGNAQISTTQSKFGGSSMYFDGTGDYLLIPSSPVFALNGDATIEFWLRVPSLPSTYSNLFTINAGTALWIYLNSAGNIGIQTGSAYRDTTTAPISANTWYHVAITKTSGNTWTVYVNGTSQASSGTGTMASTISAAIVGIGSTSAGANTLNGFIDDLRVSQFARYTSNFTAPTAAFALQ